MLNTITNINARFDLAVISDLADEMLSFPVGSVAVFNGNSSSDKSIFIAAHTDKPYLVCTAVNQNGTVKASFIGESSPRSLANSFAVSASGICAAICVTGEGDNVEFTLDFGAKDKADADKIVSVGDVFYAETTVKKLNENTVSGANLSVSAPVAALVRLCELLNSTSPSCKVFVAFINDGQFSLGSYGPVATSLNATHAVCVGSLDVTSAPDIRLGCGAVVRLADKSYGSDKPISDNLISAGAVPAVLTKGACAASKTQGAGIPSSQIDIPVKHINTNTEIIDIDDVCRAADIIFDICK